MAQIIQVEIPNHTDIRQLFDDIFNLVQEFEKELMFDPGPNLNVRVGSIYTSL